MSHGLFQCYFPSGSCRPPRIHCRLWEKLNPRLTSLLESKFHPFKSFSFLFAFSFSSITINLSFPPFIFLKLLQKLRNKPVHTATQANIKSTQNTGIVNTNRSHMTVILDSSFYSLAESSRCVFHYPPKKTQLHCGLLNVGAWPTNESRQRERSRGSAHSAPHTHLAPSWNLCQLGPVCLMWQLTRRRSFINPNMVSLCSLLRCPPLLQTSVFWRKGTRVDAIHH